MRYQSDYVMRLIERIGALLRAALEQRGRAQSETDALALLDEAVGLALDMDPALALRLSPASLVSVVELNNVDDAVVAMLADVLDAEAHELEARGELMSATLRREQGAALRALLDGSLTN